MPLLKDLIKSIRRTASVKALKGYKLNSAERQCTNMGPKLGAPNRIGWDFLTTGNIQLSDDNLLAKLDLASILLQAPEKGCSLSQDAGPVILVDASYLHMRAFHNRHSPTHYSFMLTLTKALSFIKTKERLDRYKLVLLFDNSYGELISSINSFHLPIKRIKDYPYKADRKDPSEDFVESVQLMVALMLTLGYTVINELMVDADEIIGLLAGVHSKLREAPLERPERARNQLELLIDEDGEHPQSTKCYSTRKIIIVSADKDFFSLVRNKNPEIMVCYPEIKRKLDAGGNRVYHSMLNESGVYSRTGVTSRRYPEYLALVGDRVDNIPGVKGIGDALARRLLDYLNKDHNGYTVDAFLQTYIEKEHPIAIARTMRRLAADYESYIKSRETVTIRLGILKSGLLSEKMTNGRFLY